MTITGIMLSAVLLTQNETKVYEDKSLDLRFDYPQTWKLRKERLFDVMEFNVGEEVIQVRLMKTNMTYPAAHWQEVMSVMNNQGGRIVLKQWEEELLGVPLLMTRFREGEGANIRVVLTGLLYGARPDKFNFRLSSSEKAATEAEETWFKVLLTMRTVSGLMPNEKPPETGATDPGTTSTNSKTYVLEPETNRPPKPVRGSIRVVADAERGIYAYFPDGWNLADGIASHSSGLKVKLESETAPLDLAKKNWLAAAGLLLQDLASVSERGETKAGYNKAAFTVGYMWRKGVIANGEQRAHWIAYGAGNGFTWRATWQGTPAELDAAQGTLNELASTLSLAAE